MAYIYSITNNVNQKQYIGLTRQANPYDRWKQHLEDSKYNSQNPIHRAIRKYGLQNFKFRVLEECADDKVEEREIHYIAKCNSFYEGYNATLGGNIRYDTDAKPITQYNKKGEKIRDFASLRDAAEFIDKEQSAISRCANGERFSAYGYRWSWKGDRLPILQESKYCSPYYGYNRKGEYKEWTSSVEAAKELKCGRRSITISANSKKENKLQCRGWYVFKMSEGKIDFDEITFAERYKPTSEKAKEMVKIRCQKT